MYVGLAISNFSRGRRANSWHYSLIPAAIFVVVVTGPALAQDTIKIATFNLLRPNLAASTPAVRDATLMHYGKDLLSQADVAFVQEDGDNAWTKVLSASSGLKFVTSVVTTDSQGPDMAILSRFGLTNVVLHNMPINGYWLEAQSVIATRPHLFITSHYPLKGGKGGDAAAARDAISAAIVDRVNGFQGQAFVGGDFNATPDDRAITRLAFAMWDSKTMIGGLPACNEVTTPTNGQRVDYIFYHAHYLVSAYDGCADRPPSDHRMVLGTFTFDLAAAPWPTHPAPPPPPSQCFLDCQARQQECMADAHNGPARAVCGAAGQQCKAECQ